MPRNLVFLRYCVIPDTGKAYCRTFSMRVTDLLYLHFGIDFAFVRINRVLRVGRMLEFFDRTDSRTNYPHIFRVLQLVVYMIVSIHWNACLYYQISVWIGLGSDEWVRYVV